MWFLTKKKHERIVGELEELYNDELEYKNRCIKTGEAQLKGVKKHFEILNNRVIEKDLELIKRPKFDCSDTMLMQKKIEDQRKLLDDIGYDIRSTKNTKWFCETCGIERRRDDETRKYKGGMLETIIEI